jgi:hypothetical protein
MARIKMVVVLRDRAVAEDVVGAENVAGALAHGDEVGSTLIHEGSESGYQRDAGLEDVMHVDVTADKALHTYCVGASAIMISCIRKMVALKYFTDGDAHAPGKRSFQSPRMTRLWCLKSFLLSSSECLRTLPSLKFN